MGIFEPTIYVLSKNKKKNVYPCKPHKTVQRIGNQQCEKTLNHSQTDIPMLKNLNLACFIFLISKHKKTRVGPMVLLTLT